MIWPSTTSLLIKKKKKHELQRFKGKKKSHIIDTVQLV